MVISCSSHWMPAAPTIGSKDTHCQRSTPAGVGAPSSSGESQNAVQEPEDGSNTERSSHIGSSERGDQ